MKRHGAPWRRRAWHAQRRGAPAAVWATLTVALSAGACGGEQVGAGADAAGDATTIVACHLASPLDATAAPLPDGADVELVLGFQGFVWADLVAVMPQAPADKLAKVPFSYEIDGLEPKSSQLATTFAADGRAALRLLLSPADAKLLAGRGVKLSLKIAVDGLSCLVVQRARLVDADPCVHVDDSKPCAATRRP